MFLTLLRKKLFPSDRRGCYELAKLPVEGREISLELSVIRLVAG